MRTELQWRTACVLTLVALTSVATAQDTDVVRVALSAPSRLVADTAAEVVAEITVPTGGRPVLVTPTSEGTAVEVVRGRLVRNDADEVRPDVLRFRIPIRARAPGTAVVRVRVLAYDCARRCRAVEGDAVVVLHVDRD